MAQQAGGRVTKLGMGYLSVADWLNRIAFFLLVVAMIAIFSTTLLQVIVRFLLTHMGIHASVPWAEELTRYILIWIVFLGSAVGCRMGQLISLRFIVDAAPAGIGVMLRYCALAVSLVFFVFLVWIGWEFLKLGMVERSPVLGLPKVYVYLAMPICAALMVINTVAFIIDRRVHDVSILASDGLPVE